MRLLRLGCLLPFCSIVLGMASSASASVTILSPSAGVQATNSVKISGTARESSAVVAMAIYDNYSLLFKMNGASISTTKTLSAGIHKIVIQDWYNGGRKTNRASVSITVSNTTAPSESANGSTVPPASQLVDASGSAWTITSGQQVAKNGATDSVTSSVTLLLYYNKTITQKNSYNNWYSWNGSTWIQVSGDPRGTSPSPTPTPSPIPTPKPSPTPSPGPSSGSTLPAAAAGYKLAFSDDFNPLSLSPNGVGNYNWYAGIWWQSVPPLANATYMNGALDLVWKPGQSGDFSTSIETTASNASSYKAWQYGYFEARVQWENKTIGAWPAVWMDPIEGVNGTHNTGELDIMEGQGGDFPNTYYGTLHEWNASGDVYNNSSANAYTVPSGVDMSQYHTYGMLWVPGKVTWYFDGVPVHSAATTAVIDSQHYYLILGSQAGRNWSAGSGIPSSVSSISMGVQWVHVWQK